MTYVILIIWYVWTKARPPDPPKKPDEEVTVVIDESEVEEDEMMKYQQQEFERLSRDPVMCLALNHVWFVISTIFIQYFEMFWVKSNYLPSRWLADQIRELRLEILQDFSVDMRTQILFFSLSERFGFLGRCRQGRLLRLASIVEE